MSSPFFHSFPLQAYSEEFSLTSLLGSPLSNSSSSPSTEALSSTSGTFPTSLQSPSSLSNLNENKSFRYDVVPLFNKPYVATSLQDFWGRRWNLLSSRILRETVYFPTRNALKEAVGFSHPTAKGLALVFTLVVSGIMHEIMFYYITCGKKPTWEATQYFVLQAISMVFQFALKKWFRFKGWKPVHPVVSMVFTVGFVSGTAYWKLVLPVQRSGQNQCSFNLV